MSSKKEASAELKKFAKRIQKNNRLQWPNGNVMLMQKMHQGRTVKSYLIMNKKQEK